MSSTQFIANTLFAVGGGTLYVGAFPGYYTRVDNGLNFSSITLESTGLIVNSVSAIYASGATIFTAAGSSLDISTNSGATF